MRKSLKTKIQELIEWELRYSDHVDIDSIHEDEVIVGRTHQKFFAQELAEKIVKLIK